MTIASLNPTRSQCPITKNERISFIRVHRFLKEQQETGNLATTVPLRKLLKEALGVGERTASKIIQYSNADQLLDEGKPIGRPKKKLSEDYIKCIRDFTLQYNQIGTPVTAEGIRKHVLENG
ncbi:hypothetical protein BDA99DRAFT_556659 [Phascolomyces articulosus]|uniref:Uncharacterized protein n=1 Tax=Phascolomyces articulosus TaxID=60185 RepID=A0AAD5KJ96_9FUNG|nr:hypothetical protein BDA99DRAFT_556659 [Phascolomyces articulosus]